MIPKNETLHGAAISRTIVVMDPCTCIVRPYCAPVSCVCVCAKTGSYALYLEVSGYREYVIFNALFHKLVAGAYASFGLSVNCGDGEGLTKYEMYLQRIPTRFTL